MAPTRIRYAELHCHSNGSFLQGASHVHDLVARAAELGYRALAITDRDGLYAAVQLHRAAREHGVKAIHGACVTLTSGHHVRLLVRNGAGWKNLSSLLTRGRMRRKKGQSAVTPAEVAAHADGLIALTRCRDEAVVRSYLDAFGRHNVFLELQDHLLPRQTRHNAHLEQLGQELGVPRVATGAVHYATSAGRKLQDVLTAVRAKTTLDQAGTLLYPNGERFMKPLDDIAIRFRVHEGAITQSASIADRCTFSLSELSYRFPAFPVPDRETAFSLLHRLVHEGARTRYRPMTPAASKQIAHELDVIERLDLAGYFLIVWDIVRFARERGILCQGRGSAANSALCYCLGITAVDPVGLDLLFERFISEERKETPDIDLDFPHRDREQVIQYVYQRYGRDHAGMVCEFITYRGRSAVRDVGKALGLSLKQVENLATSLDAHAPTHAVSAGGKRGQLLSELVQAVARFPRHLSIHTGGMVITERPLHEVVPIENAAMPGRSVIQWDKDDLADLGIIKIDLLGLGMLTVIQDAFALVKQHEGIELELATLRPDDPKVYDMLCKADTVGVFQIESRAQMNTLPRLKPRNFYDLVVEVALIRPGPIQGEMVHPYLRRRAGKEKVTYPHPSLEPILKRTLGVPLFQEQGMKLAVTAAGFTPGEADELRRAMGHKRSHEQMSALARRLIEGMQRNGIPADIAARIFKQLSAFADYGFPESHAASFALLVYASAYLKCHHHTAFTTAMLNAQPMGFYSPATLINDAKRHGVKFLPIDARESRYDCVIEAASDGRDAIRIGLRYVRGVGEAVKVTFEAARAERPFASVEDFVERAAFPRECLENLALLGGFRGFGVTEPRKALWAVQALTRKRAGPLADARPRERDVTLPPLSEAEAMETDYALSGLSTDRQPMHLFRPFLNTKKTTRASDLRHVRNGQTVRIAGMVICRQRPPTAKGFTFLTLEDETGLSNVVVPPSVYPDHRDLVRSAPLIIVDGQLEKVDAVINVKAERFYRLGSATLVDGVRSHDFR